MRPSTLPSAPSPRRARARGGHPFRGGARGIAPRLAASLLASLLVSCPGERAPAAPDAGPKASPPRSAVREEEAPPAGGRPLYLADRTQSPIPRDVADRLRAVGGRDPGLRPAVFMKVGDSTSAGGIRGPFLACLDPASRADVNLGGRSDLAEAAAYFRTVKATASESSYARDSLAVEVGQNAEWATTGSPSPLEREVAAVRPGVALVMFGSNDVGCYGCGLADAEMASIYFGNMRRIVDGLLARGVVPVVSSMPPRSDDAADLRRLPLFANATRALAQGREVPFIDYQREMLPLPGLGLGPDGVHPSFCRIGPATACRFDDASCGGRKFLEYGYNVRNLVTLEALARVKAVLADGVPALDASPPRMRGQGTFASPFQAERLPFTDLRDPAREGARKAASYGCPGSKAAPGPEVVYRLALERRTALRIAVLDGSSTLSGPSRFALFLLGASGRPEDCLRSSDRSIGATLAPGDYRVVVDSLAQKGGGEFALVVVECAPGDGCE